MCTFFVTVYKSLPSLGVFSRRASAGPEREQVMEVVVVLSELGQEGKTAEAWAESCHSQRKKELFGTATVRERASERAAWDSHSERASERAA